MIDFFFGLNGLILRRINLDKLAGDTVQYKDDVTPLITFCLVSFICKSLFFDPTLSVAQKDSPGIRSICIQ